MSKLEWSLDNFLRTCQTNCNTFLFVFSTLHWIFQFHRINFMLNIFGMFISCQCDSQICCCTELPSSQLCVFCVCACICFVRDDYRLLQAAPLCVKVSWLDVHSTSFLHRSLKHVFCLMPRHDPYLASGKKDLSLPHVCLLLVLLAFSQAFFCIS